MPSTELFAPIVGAVQPAFIYTDTTGGEVKIYFSYSSYNEYVAGDKINIVITDPNKTSTWGDNKIYEVFDRVIPEANQNGLHEITLYFTPTSNVKFVTNQYYQVQLTLKRTKEIGDKEITYISPVSQVTLIRPIPAVSALVIEQFIDENELIINPKLNKLSGYIAYSDNSKYELIKEYSFIIKEVGGKSLYSSPIIKNMLGTRFETEIPKLLYTSGTNYNITFTFTTINGYVGTTNRYFKYVRVEENDLQTGPNFTARQNYNKGCLELTFDFENQNFGDMGIPNVSFSLHKSSQEDGYLKWEEIGYGNIITLNSESKIIWEDYQFTNGVNYKYKLKITKENETEPSIYNGCTDSKGNVIIYQASMKIEDIYLADTNMLVPIKYNAKVSGFKWVVQENITNTLGGVYPIIRRNADTYYRQFTLSGTLDFKVPKYTLDTDSTSKSLSAYSHVFDEFVPVCLSLSESSIYQQSIQDHHVPDVAAREYIMKFLTDGQIKLFKSGPEGEMLVHLSNVSFTPNIQLGREIVDFSCTVTEIAPVTKENLQRYSILNYGTFLTYLYCLDIEGFMMSDENVSIPYISINEIFKSDKNETLRIQKREVRGSVGVAL